ncbi:S-methyl-5'-thioadenosine phosphorylase [Rhizobium sp. CFBP 8762]|uniref:S-methyl-5'-thioadenosine phosphorylase n=1 Tax=Rhizobium sp. CFBP 8762 TaxID=2775279 RepID=UPI0017810B2E|nr:S-methyl-5'-thioadenosine phosphorylase [Rhizobium sp. CFBP 8762]MBD8555180.1 S-methyl-5'-thioadenosine phosphorylase [Rhizobium sp. CFBP 8762]
MSGHHTIGIISGSGMQSMAILKDVAEVAVETPFGQPSAPLITGNIHDVPVVVMRRHGLGHTTLPSEINARANITALKLLGVRQVVSLSAVGGLAEHAPPGTFVLVDQFIDRTYLRKKTFFGDGIVAHVSFAEPVCSDTSKVIVSSLRDQSIPHHVGGTYVVMEGPQFSTKAESEFHRSLGATVIGMTAMPEPKLCREAEMCYNMIAMVTDFDCWHPDHGAVTADLVSKRMAQNAMNAEKLLADLVPRLSARTSQCVSHCHYALDGAIMTDTSQIPSESKKKLNFLLKRVLGEDNESII